jgi:V8-like Glu-specific endopeptidase
MAEPDPKDRQSLAEERGKLLEALAQATVDLGGRYAEAQKLANHMRKARAFDELGVLCDALRFHNGGDAMLHVWEAQSLVDQGMPFAARDVLLAARGFATEGEEPWFELQGLLGRAAKQIFIDHSGQMPAKALPYLEEALAAYTAAYVKNPQKAFWHGGNIAALLARKSQLAARGTNATECSAFAADLRRTLDAIPSDGRDYWWYATSAEAELGRGRYEQFVEELKKFVDHRGADNKPDTDAFAVHSMLRQLREVWEIDSNTAPPVPRAALALLSGKLLEWSGPGELDKPLQLSAEAVAADRRADPDAVEQLQKTFGPDAPMLIGWWELGIRRAKSVAAIYGQGPLGPRREGTGFLVKVRTCDQADVGCFVLTNAHVIGDPDASVVAVESYKNATVRFEGYDAKRDFPIKGIRWTSPYAKHDATLVEIDGCPQELEPIPVTASLPAPASGRRLYIIGHAGGNELAFSFEDNRLLDHEANTASPRQDGVILIHYRTPTSGGSSGSPVFVEQLWTAIGLHHSGSAKMQKLNGKPGIYQANEGVALSSISAALTSSMGWELCL